MKTHAVRLRLEVREEGLSPFACRSARSRGRRVPEEPSLLRTEFQRDRDRILHTNAFRRLKHKTQVFIAPLGDHYVTRLTHTLEVAQISRTIARALNLNEDLVEAIALGHDLGHTPFGHVGEQELDRLYSGGFRHSDQSLRVVDHLEKNGQGLNLTWEVRQGIVAHSKGRGDFLGQKGVQALTLEAQVCRLADAIAYINHDIGDAIRAGILREEDLPVGATRVLGYRHSERINTMVTDVVEASWAATGEVVLVEGSRPQITMHPRVRRAMTLLREYLFEQVYLPTGQGQEGQRAREVVRLLYCYFTSHPEAVPEEYGVRREAGERRIVDYIAGMTDQYASRLAAGVQKEVA